MRVEVVSVNVSQQKGTAKLPVDQIVVDDLGIVGDAHAGHWHRQVSLLAQETVQRFSAELGQSIAPGEFGENMTFRGIPAQEVAPLDTFAFGDVELEVTQVGKECHGSGCTIFQQVGKCVMPAEGLFARTVRGGIIRRGDWGVFRPRPFTCLVLTLSDRAAAGRYADRSGPRIEELLKTFFANRRWRPEISSQILPDDPEQLRQEIHGATERGTDVVFTTGGTGVGPRDITPEVVASLCDKLIPGVMEHIRMKSAQQNPRAPAQSLDRRRDRPDANLHAAGQRSRRRRVLGGNSEDPGAHGLYAPRVGPTPMCRAMISPDEALTLVVQAASPCSPQSACLAKARGLCLAEPIYADRDYPPFPRAMMDGFAVRLADAGQIVSVVGEIPAGRVWNNELVPGQCLEILTGAPCPPAAEAVVKKENVDRRGNQVRLPEVIEPGQHIARQGSECQKGRQVFGCRRRGHTAGDGRDGSLRHYLGDGRPPAANWHYYYWQRTHGPGTATGAWPDSRLEWPDAVGDDRSTGNRRTAATGCKRQPGGDRRRPGSFCRAGSRHLWPAVFQRERTTWFLMP